MGTKQLRLLAFSVLLLVTSQEALSQGLEEIIVTAQRREQNIQDVSLSIAAFSGEQLKELRVFDVTNVSKLVTNAVIYRNFSNVNPIVSIRGVGLNDYGSNNSSSVGIYIDEVFLTHQGMLDFASFDVERLEVLKGPQGTLYGRNTNGGSISYYTRKPNHEERDGYVTVTGANYERVEVEAVIGGPFTDQLAGRLSFRSAYQGETFWDNQVGGDFGDSQKTNVRGQLSFISPKETARVNLSVSYFDADMAFYPGQVFPILVPGDGITNSGVFCPSHLANGFPALDGSCETGAQEVPSDTDPWHALYADGHFGDNEQDGYQILGKVEFDLTDTMTLTSITAYQDMDRVWYDNSFASELGLFLFEADHTEEMSFFSQEIRVAGQNDRLDWIVGLYYSDDDIESATPYSPRDLPLLLGLETNTVYDQERTAFALFAHTDWRLTDRWSVVAGIRYNRDELDFIGGTDLIDPGPPPVIIPLTSGTVKEIEDDSWTGRAGLEYRPNDDWLLYGSFARGFKPGIVFSDVTFDPSELTQVDSETLNSLEVGFKGTLLNGNLQTNGAFFYYDYDGVQTLAPATVGFLFINAGEAEVFGAELDVSWAPTENFTLRGGFSWLDSEITDDKQTGVLNGNNLTYSPNYQVTLLANYDIPMGTNYTVRLQADWKYTDDYFRQVVSTPSDHTESYNLLGARATWLPNAGNWEVSIWGENLTDEDIIMFGLDSPAIGQLLRNYAPPRTYGGTVTFRF